MRRWVALIGIVLVVACSTTSVSPSPGASPTALATASATAGASSTPTAPSSAGATPSTEIPASASPSPSIAPTPADPLTAALQEVVDKWRSQSDAPAAVIGLRLATGQTAIAASGQADELAGTSLTTDDRFRIGSITKTFVAVVMLQLEADGLLDIGDRLSKYLPDAPHADDVTIRQLLDHTSGIPDFAVLPAYDFAILANPARRWTAEETIQTIAGKPLEFEPGSEWQYSNTNYVLLGMLGEKVGGAPIAQLLRERVYQPLGLDSTFLEEEESGPPMRVAGHFDLNRDGTADNVSNIPYTAIVTSGAAAGGISANALDVLDFASGLFDGRLLNERSLDEMLTIHKPSTTYGLGIGKRNFGDRDAWGHAGAIPGFSALFLRADDGSIGVAMANQTGVEVADLMRSAVRAAAATP